MTSSSEESVNLLKKRPLTAAEKSKRYRERLKRNPEKYMITKEKSRRRSAKHYKEKVKALTEEKLNEMRIKWRQKYASKKESLRKRPLTAAEKSKRYRERLKSNPEKYMITKEKSRKRAAKHYKEKVKALTEEKLSEMRIKWRQKYASKKESLSKITTMPQIYKTKPGSKKRNKLDKKILKNAVAAVLGGKSIRGSAKEYGVPAMTLRRYARKQQESETEIAYEPNYRQSQIFSDKEENDLSAYLKKASKPYHSLTPKNVRKLAYQFAFQNKKEIHAKWSEKEEATYDWFHGFMSRQKELSLRKPEATSLSRETSFNRHNLEAINNICAVSGCGKESYPGCGLSFHSLPSDLELKKKWLEVIPGNLRQSSVVCSLHFKPEDYRTEARKKLKPGVTPSIFPKTRRSSVENDEFEVEALESEDDDDEDDDPLANMCNTDEDEEKPAPFLEPRPNNRHDKFETLASPETIPACIKTEEYLVSESVHTNHRTGYDEYDHFGQMLASKIRKIKNVGTREELMISIQNLAYKFYKRDMKNNSK